MKTFLLLTSLAVAAVTPAFAAETTISRLANDTFTLDAETLDYLTSRVRVSVGMERGTVIDQLGEPQVMAHPDLWVFTGFRASNVFGAERYDTLLVAFRGDRVVTVTLTNAQAIRTAAIRQKDAAKSRMAAAD
jgi:hypothetical protein